ncbi:MAG: TonB-dependent receptor, partial [Gammaproteobacteria bacterium]|nr:TonB-dependent receptor [Gammaproteobacteria bacterium]
GLYLGLIFGAPAYAQIEEIIVVAQKREENLQSVPIAMSAYDATALDARAIESITDMSNPTPGLIVSGNLRSAQIFIRGIGSEDISIGTEGSTAVYLDGVYLGRTEMALTEFLDVERVEVLRGPQGTLYGRNAVGGAINVLSKPPTDELWLSGSVLAGNFHRLRVRGTASGPISEKVRGRVSFVDNNHDGFVTNGLPGAPRKFFHDEDYFGARSSLVLDLNDSIDVSIGADYSRSDDNGKVNINFMTPDFLVAAGATPVVDPFTVFQDMPVFHDLENYGGHVTVAWNLGTYALKSISSYRKVEEVALFDSDGTEAFGVFVDLARNQQQFSQELRMLSPADERFSWIAGLFYFYEDADQKFDLWFPGPSLLPLSATNQTDAYAAYFQGSLQLSDRLAATAGLRFSYEEKEGSNAGGPISDSWNEATPKLLVEYYANEAVLLYASATKGFKSGGFQSLGIQPSTFDEEIVWAYEGGIKSLWFDSRLRINASVFFYDYSDLQVQTVDETTLEVFIENAASSSITGGEIEVTAQPSDDLTLELWLAFLDAEYDEFIGLDPILGGAIDLSGNSLRSAPDLSFGVAAQYQLNLAIHGSVTLRGEYQWQDDVFFNQFEDPLIGQQSFGLLNARVTWVTANERFGVSLFAKNITNEAYFSTGITFGFGPLGVIADPRTYGIELTVAY